MNAHALRLAFQFLTRLPVRAAPPTPEAMGRAVVLFPLVGLAIGFILWLLDGLLLGDVEPLLRAAVLLLAWVGITGALHLDGLADSADAWMGGQGDRERTLAIMKDPRSGPAGVVAVVLVLLLKFAALASLPSVALLIAPLLGRATLPLLFLTTPYVRAGGLGEAMAGHLPRRAARAAVLLAILALPVIAGGAGLLLIPLWLAFVFLFHRALLARIGGSTGDTAGAAVELSEALALVILALHF